MYFYKFRMSVLCVCLAVSFTGHAKNAYVFISFSMPKQLLIDTLSDCAHFKIPAVLNGLSQNSMMSTAAKITDLTKEVPQVAIQIDPTAFERFGISQVPALVVQNDRCFDVIYGNLPITEGMERIKRQGLCEKGKSI